MHFSSRCSAFVLAAGTFAMPAFGQAPSASADPFAASGAPPSAPPPAVVRAPEAPHAEPFGARKPPPEVPVAYEKYPRLGGHVGMALPIVTLAKNSTAIGADFVTIGLTPGITVHLDDKWSLDFEFIAFNELKNTPANTTFIVDPGVVRNFGPVSAGLRVATQVGAPTNIGLVPILVIPVIKLSKRISYFVEADLPLFLRDDGKAMRPSATFLFQTGFGF
jgi:hypothetical protein